MQGNCSLYRRVRELYQRENWKASEFHEDVQEMVGREKGSKH